MAQHAYIGTAIVRHHGDIVSVQEFGWRRRTPEQWDRLRGHFVGRRARRSYELTTHGEKYAEFRLKNSDNIPEFRRNSMYAVGYNRRDALLNWRRANPRKDGTVSAKSFDYYESVLPRTTTPDVPGNARSVGAKRVVVYCMDDIHDLD